MNLTSTLTWKKEVNLRDFVGGAYLILETLIISFACKYLQQIHITSVWDVHEGHKDTGVIFTSLHYLHWLACGVYIHRLFTMDLCDICIAAMFGVKVPGTDFKRPLILMKEKWRWFQAKWLYRNGQLQLLVSSSTYMYDRTRD